jgi:hypothetical protein
MRGRAENESPDLANLVRIQEKLDVSVTLHLWPTLQLGGDRIVGDLDFGRMGPH